MNTKSLKFAYFNFKWSWWIFCPKWISITTWNPFAALQKSRISNKNVILSIRCTISFVCDFVLHSFSIRNAFSDMIEIYSVDLTLSFRCFCWTEKLFGMEMRSQHATVTITHGCVSIGCWINNANMNKCYWRDALFVKCGYMFSSGDCFCADGIQLIFRLRPTGQRQKPVKMRDEWENNIQSHKEFNFHLVQREWKFACEQPFWSTNCLKSKTVHFFRSQFPTQC